MVDSYNWEENGEEIARLAPLADAIEIAGCTDLGDGALERCNSAENADMFSVYFHFSPVNGEGLHGALDIADFDFYGEAAAYARHLSAQYALPVKDFT